MVDLLDKDFKTTVWKILKIIKEDIEKNQENNIWTKQKTSKKIENKNNPKRNPTAEKVQLKWKIR